ncbi:hypothetical protein KGG73_gp23 [Streptomyces phage Sentinel]|uniref:Uncharacterized protein n=1 Tax=Streptomyces phage Sentinel TaxID=2767584 RepID=A0A873WED7_9CAUD|nr:hypothetical protein KGG73_gp23 [Streptomyces phage Sentinel]QPB09857.1 hypothetical protein CPT_Sentinel_023 [Streptomyces phage Sentinel]
MSSQPFWASISSSVTIFGRRRAGTVFLAAAFLAGLFGTTGCASTSGSLTSNSSSRSSR